MKKLKWHGIAFSLLILFIYIMGTYDFFMMLSHNEAYYVSKGYGEIIHDYFTDYPVAGLVLWVGNLVSGLTAPILYLLKNKWAYIAAYASFFVGSVPDLIWSDMEESISASLTCRLFALIFSF